MAQSIFVNYRHSDAQHAAIAIAETLRWTFAEGEVFFDRTSIQGGEVWPNSIKNALSNSKVLVAIIGRDWLRAHDDYGRRKIDHPNDWVRQELLFGIEQNLVIIPVLLDGAYVPPIEALDQPLHLLPQYQAQRVRVESWDSDLTKLIDTLTSLTGVSHRAKPAFPNGIPIPRPMPVQKKRKLLTPTQLDDQIIKMSSWKVEENYHSWAVGGKATELVRVYEFSSFIDTINFMTYAANEINSWNPQHHPRWENQWRSLRVCFTTWDVGCRITKLDVSSATKMDKLFFNFTKR